MPFMAFLFLALAFSMAAATFIESSYGTSTAHAVVYGAHWFEVLWLLLAINLTNNLVKYKLFRKQKITLGLFHVSFLIMIFGAAITRYFSYEGMMHIRENQSSDFILSSSDYFYAGIENQEKDKKVKFSELSPKQFSANFNVNGEKIKIKSVGFIANAERKAVPAENGEPVVDFVFSAPGGKGMQAYTMRRGNVFNYPGFRVGFEIEEQRTVNMFIKNGNLFMTSLLQIEGATMSNEKSVSYPPGDTIAVQNMFLYGFRDYRFLVKNFYLSAMFTAVESKNQTNEDAVLIQISDGTIKQTVPVFGHSGMIPDTVSVPFGNSTLKFAYGAKQLNVPFTIYLKDFQLEKYAGSNSPSSFASEVVLQDERTGVKKDIRIFMNNTLTYKGYKFFQSSYDTDEQGTVLSVNHDFWGTWITYLGYFLLMLGTILSLVNKNSHFQMLIRKLKQSSIKTVVLLFIFGGLVFNASAQTVSDTDIPEIDNQLVKEFSQLWVQGVDGRIEPVSTLTSEIVRKISRKSSLFGRSADEVVLSMMVYPQIWQKLPIIKVSNKTLANKLGATNKFIAIKQLFDDQGNYKIAGTVQAAYAKTPALRNRVDKEYIYVDERVNICFMIFRNSFLNLFPGKNRYASWYSPGTVAHDYSGRDSIFIKNGFQLLTQSVSENKNADALNVLQAVANFQQKFGGDLLPSDNKKDVEIFYNKINPFKRVFPFYLALGFVLLFLLFVNIFRQKQLPGYLRISFFSLILISFLIHTGGMILRWYIAGHAPWSNGYESVVYVAWASMLAGFIFGRKYPTVLGTAAFFAGITLFVAHLSWMNPEVTNLVPVLKSYWLTIHVAVITASYGFIGLSWFLGILVLILIVLRNKTNEENVTGFINQLTTINEMSATIGLYFLTIGTFLGAIWANESWGRYWGWDAKETWSLITIVVYSFIVHMRLIPSLKGIFNYNLASVIGFASVIMTYFGVNYYLTGLHSYGKGAANGINPAVPVVLVVLAALIVWASFKDSQFENGE